MWRSQRRMPDGLVRFMCLVSVVRLFGEYVATVGKREHGGSETVEGAVAAATRFVGTGTKRMMSRSGVRCA